LFALNTLPKSLLYFLISLYISIINNTDVASKNRYNKCIKGIESVCKNLAINGTSITNICKIIEVKKAMPINLLSLIGIENADDIIEDLDQALNEALK
jgi:hypothetical protein